MPNRPHYLDELLLAHLQAFLGEADPATLALLQRQLVWIDLPGGQPLMTQGEPGDAMYVLVSGRLRVSITDAGGRERTVREITRGQVVGEMSLFTDDPRSATLVAVRDSVLARLGKAEFGHLLAASSAVSIALTRQVIRRLQTEGQLSRLDRPVAIGLLPISASIGAAAANEFAERLAAQLRLRGPVAVVDAARLEARIGLPGITGPHANDAEAARRIAVCLDQIEAEHAFVLLLADNEPTPWTRCCSRHCDELLLLADADASPELSDTEVECLAVRPARTDAAEILLLLHPAQRLSPTGTRDWLRPRTLAAHVHLRAGHAGDIERLGRLVSRTATGLVLAGGGARGAAHAGVFKALGERGVPVDVVGGTSMGAVFGAVIALDASPASVIETFAEHFAQKPTGDYNVLPLLSLIKGRRLRGMMQRTEKALGGSADLGIEDLWKTYYCVATNYSQAREQVLRSGPLVNAVMASCAIPGALPPVLHDGDLLCDGGTFNNFPADVMRGVWGVGRVIGVDLSFEKPRRIEHQHLPGPWTLLRDLLRPRRQRRYRLPSLTNYLMNVTSLYSSSRQAASRLLTDVYMRPELSKVGMLQWDRYVPTVQQGYEHALQVLDAETPGNA
ncbi:MAG: cyclic nucleotide-binding and patatin-like phospholipase domain-containing protein [Pseudomonadota bacterium]